MEKGIKISVGPGEAGMETVDFEIKDLSKKRAVEILKLVAANIEEKLKLSFDKDDGSGI